MVFLSSLAIRHWHSHKSSQQHGVWKSQNKYHSTLRAKRATFTFWVDKSWLKMPKMVHFGEVLRTWSLRSNSVTRQVSFNRTKIGGKYKNYKNSNATLSHFQTMCNRVSSDPKFFRKVRFIDCFSASFLSILRAIAHWLASMTSERKGESPPCLLLSAFSWKLTELWEMVGQMILPSSLHRLCPSSSLSHGRTYESYIIESIRISIKMDSNTKLKNLIHPSFVR